MMLPILEMRVVLTAAPDLLAVLERIALVIARRPVEPVLAPMPPPLPDLPPVQDATAPAPEPTGRLKRWTPERDAVIRRDYPRDIDNAMILAQVNALPGLPCNAKMIGIRAFALGVGRSQARLATHGFPKPAAPKAMSAPVASAPPPQPPAPEPAAPRPARVHLPPASANGKIYAAPATISAWIAQFGVDFKGDMLPVNRVAARMGMPEIVCDASLAEAAA